MLTFEGMDNLTSHHFILYNLDLPENKLLGNRERHGLRQSQVSIAV